MNHSSTSFSSRAREIILQLLILAAGITLCNLAKAQNYGQYRGPRNGIPSVNRPTDYQECAHRYPRNGGPVVQRLYDACRLGVIEAHRMAERFAAGHGRVEGYFQGYAWGLHEAADPTVADPRRYNSNEYDLGYSLVNLSPQMQNGLDAGASTAIASAQESGSREGRSEAIRRFEAAVDTGTFPSKSYTVPNSTYVSRFQNPYSSFVGNPKSIDDLLRDINYEGRMNPYYDYDSVYMGDHPPLHPWELHTRDGMYNYDNGNWMNADYALRQWLALNIDRREYDNLGTVPDPNAVVPSNGQPAPAGAHPPIQVSGTGGTHPPAPAGGTAGSTTPPTPVQTIPQIDLHVICQQAFREAYAQYAPYFYWEGFNSRLPEGQYFGVMIGQEAARRYARERGTMEGYNRRFIETETAAYHDAFAGDGTPQNPGSYAKSFLGTYEDYATHPKLGLEFIDVVGAVDDGILQPGEWISAVFKVRNSGGVAANLNYSLEGDVIKASAATGNIGALKSKTFSAPTILGQINPNLASETDANFVLNVNGLRAPLSRLVTRQVTPVSITYEANIPAGTAKITVKVQNHSKVRSTDSVKVTLAGNGKTLEQSIGFVDAGEISSAIFTISGINPMDILDPETDGSGGHSSVSFTAQTYLGSQVMGTNSVTVESPNPMLDIAKYFVNSANDDSKAAVADGLVETLTQIMVREIHDIPSGAYKDDEGKNRLLCNALKVSIEGRSHSENAKEIFAKLGNNISYLKKKLGILGSNKPRFKDLLSDLGV